MFTGIVEEIGTIKKISRSGLDTVLSINANKVLEGTKIGDSIAVNGVCLTVTKLDNSSFDAFAMAETMRMTAFSDFKTGSVVNLERAMSAEGRFGGHIVSGHIDGTGVIRSIKEEGRATWVEIQTSKDILKYVVYKGSIAIDGISLTVAGLTEDSFKVSLIPHTGEETTLLKKKISAKVNLENDVVGKYVERLLKFDSGNGDNTAAKADSKTDASNRGGLTREMLLKNGF